jgi:hypothetical protein
MRVAYLDSHGGLFILVVIQLPPWLLRLVGATLCGRFDASTNRLRPQHWPATPLGGFAAIRRAEPSSHKVPFGMC